MPIMNYKHAEIYYEFHGDKSMPAITFVNGLTQRTKHWLKYAEYFNKEGYSVLLFDLMGQGQSEKPVLFVEFRENQDILAGLLEEVGVDKAYVAGISFGGIVALRFAIEYPEMTAGIIPMSTFSEMDEHLYAIGANLYEGMVSVGFEYLVKLLLPFNFSADWIKKNKDKIDVTIRESVANNDIYAIENLMDSVNKFKGFTPDLKNISCPALILNGEYDYLTPRKLHEILRLNIKNSILVIMQHVCHAFTLEIPEVTCRVIKEFLDSVKNKTFKGDKSVYIASDDFNAEEIFIPCKGDHTRAVPI
jgi:pimeloyl-ACP methyl ester carboxylesterase